MLHKSSAAVVLHCGVVIFSAFPLRGRCRLRRMRCKLSALSCQLLASELRYQIAKLPIQIRA